MEEKYYAQWISTFMKLERKAFERIGYYYASPKEFYEADLEQLDLVLTVEQKAEYVQQKMKFPSEQALVENYLKLEEDGIHYTWLGQNDYPNKLYQIPDPPYGLYYMGELPKTEKGGVAIIGARQCSEYGAYVAGQLGELLGKYHIPVISGMARGIDGIGQSKALEAGGKSFGVLGCGVNVCYPRENVELYERLKKQGGVISSYPVDTQPLPFLFPARNRIVSGLADVVVVVEAKLKSGTLITVDMALEQGKEVYAVPGRVTDRLSDGCNKLIRQGAQVFTSPKQFVEEMFGDTALIRKSMQNKTDILLEGIEKELFERLDVTPKSVEKIGEEIGNTNTSQLNVALMELCLKKIAKQVSPGCFVKI